MKAKIQRWNKGISEKQAKQGEKDISEASSPPVLTDQRQILNIAVSDQKLAGVQNVELLPKAFKLGSNIWEGVFPGQ